MEHRLFYTVDLVLFYNEALPTDPLLQKFKI